MYVFDFEVNLQSFAVVAVRGVVIQKDSPTQRDKSWLLVYVCVCVREPYCVNDVVTVISTAVSFDFQCVGLGANQPSCCGENLKIKTLLPS